jgi:hypothetical protein
MKHKSYKNIITIFSLCFLGTLFGQKFDERFTENFKVNKDVEVTINASNAEINVTTWHKNEVEIVACIEIEGLSKVEAKKYFKNWNFEALGNKNKVKIMAKGNNSLGLKDDFIIFSNMDFKFPKIEMPNFDSIVIPDMNFDFNFDFDFDFDFDTENILKDLDDLDKNMGKTGKYSFEWNKGIDKITVKSKKEWEAFKKSKKYKELQLTMQKEKLKRERSFAKSKIEMKKGLAKAKLEYKEIDKEKIKKELQKAKERIMKMKLNINSNIDNIHIDGRKIKINKRLEIKVPKAATFDLNTRHCKVKLPNITAYGKVSYGSFNADNLTKSELTIEYATVKINTLNACTLFLNNVTDAKIASVTNSKIANNSSVVKIVKINENVNVSDKFGELTIDSFNPNFGEFVLNVNQSNATVILGNVNSTFKHTLNSVRFDTKSLKKSNKNTSTNNIIKVNGDYSQIVIK